MRTRSKKVTSQKNQLSIDAELIISLLKSGIGVELQAAGYSMFPVLKPGITVIVKRISDGVVPERGSVVVFHDKGVLRMHRITEINSDVKGELSFITRGDSSKVPDPPCSSEQLIGIAVSYIKRGKQHSIRTFIPGKMKYFYNRCILKIYGIIKRLF
jgi:signal peptidase I